MAGGWLPSQAISRTRMLEELPASKITPASRWDGIQPALMPPDTKARLAARAPPHAAPAQQR